MGAYMKPNPDFSVAGGVVYCSVLSNHPLKSTMHGNSWYAKGFFEENVIEKYFNDLKI